MTHRKSSSLPLLNRKKVPMIAVAAAITSLGIFISDQMPDPREVEFSHFEYTDEIPGHTRISQVDVHTRPLASGDYAEFTGTLPENEELSELYEVAVGFTLERTHAYPLSLKLEDSEGRVFRTTTPQCDAEVVSLPMTCTSLFVLPEDSLGPATLALEVENLLGDFHQQPVPMGKELHTAVEVKA